MSRKKLLMGLGFLGASAAIAITSALAGIVEFPPAPANNVILDERDLLNPILTGKFILDDQRTGLGNFYLSCRKGTISRYRFNIIYKSTYDKSLLKQIWQGQKLAIAIKNTKVQTDNTLELSDGNRLSGFLAISEPIVNFTKGFDPIQIDDWGTIYLKSFVDANFLQAFLRGDQFVLVRRNDKTQSTHVLTPYSIIPEYVQRFMAACSVLPESADADLKAIR